MSWGAEGVKDYWLVFIHKLHQYPSMVGGKYGRQCRCHWAPCLLNACLVYCDQIFMCRASEHLRLLSELLEPLQT